MIKSMKAIALFYLVLFSIIGFSHEPKIYDCFLFFNELAVLDVRLHELYNHVDKFVLVEATETFRGNPKPLYYQENKHLFKKFTDKIIHIIVEDRIDVPSPWDREEFQRNQIRRGLLDCQSEDVILISDVDEIIRASVLPEITTFLKSYGGLVTCLQPIYRFFLNRLDPGEVFWAGSTAILFKDFQTAENCRRSRHWPTLKIPYAGWHFTSICDNAGYVQKLGAFSHAESDTPENKEPKEIKRHLEILSLVPIDETFPKYVRDNITKAKQRKLIDPTS